MSFRVPESSEPPSTPNTRNSRSFFAHPSTTPAGPPPTHFTNHSTTPAGPPPRSVFGSSYNPSNDTFPRIRGSSSRGFSVPESSPPREYDEDEYARVESRINGGMGRSEALPKSLFMDSLVNSPRGSKRSRNGTVREPQESDMSRIAHGLFSQSGPTQLKESDDLILVGEDVVSIADAEVQNLPADKVEAVTSNSVAQLSRLWRRAYKPQTKEGGVGPVSTEPAAKASYLASLLLQLHQPHSSKAAPTANNTRSQNVTLPRALLDWLDEYHTPFPDDYEPMLHNEPSPSAHESFWDVVYSSVLRGKFERTIRLLSAAGWEDAITAVDDGAEDPGYTGRQLENTEAVVSRCITVLQSCPAIRYGDWDVKGADWFAFRQRVNKAISELENFAEGHGSVADEAKSNVFARSMQGSMSLSTASRKAESKVPWSIYENLKVVYGQLLGAVDETLLPSQDWLEASIFLTVWWDGEDEESMTRSMNRSTLRKTANASVITREVDVAPIAAYGKRLADAFSLVTDNPEDVVFSVDTLDPVQVGLACAMEGHVGSVFGLLRAWSMPIAATTIEMAGLGGWLSQQRSRNQGLLEQGFSSEDLLLLSQGPGSQMSANHINRDEVMCQYADILSGRGQLRSADGRVERDGWELALSVLGRLDDTSMAQERISELLDGIELDSQEKVDKVLHLCSGLGLTEQTRAISERYADHLAGSSQEYGAALLFYARAYDTVKTRSTLALLTSLSLLQSAAMPPQAQLDQDLASLLSKDRAGLVRLAQSDPEAAASLAQCLSGYATVRRFYDLRDEACNVGDLESDYRPLEQRREAANALMKAIESASDCIRGGLFDPDVEPAVPVEGLLVLLGEALPLLGQDKRIFTQAQVFILLRVVEDLATAPLRIHENCEDLLRASMSAFNGGSTPHRMPEKSRSDLSSKSGLSGGSWDLMNSSIMMVSQEKGQTPHRQRGWDWRQGLKEIGGQAATFGTKELLTIMRLALAQEAAKGWTGRVNW